MEQIEFTRRAILAAIGAATLAGCVHAPGPAAGSLTLDEIVRRNTLARGGSAALDRVRSLVSDVEINEGGQQLFGHYAASVQGLVRVDVYAGGKSVFSEGIDSQGAWLWTGGKDPPKPSVEGGRAALLNGAHNHLYGWHRFPALGHKLALMPPAVIDGVAHPVVEVRYATGQVSYFYLDPNSWLVVRRRDERAYHPDVDPTKKKVESRYGGHSAVDGVIFSTRDDDYDLATGKLLATFRSFGKRINPQFAPDHFDRNRRADLVARRLSSCACGASPSPSWRRRCGCASGRSRRSCRLCPAC